MFKLTKEEVTVWTPNHGYVRHKPSPEWCAFIDGSETDIEDGLQAAGYSKQMSSDADNEFDLEIYEHETTGELIVILELTHIQWLSGATVSGQHADAFMFTEFMRLREQLTRINAAESQRIAHKAQVAFIRHGHGTSTISESGKTKEELDLMRDNQRMRDQRRREQQSDT